MESPENLPKPSMTEVETLQFLTEKRIKPLEKFEPGKPILAVFEDIYRGKPGPFSHLSPDKRPSIARIDEPSELDLNDPQEDEDTPGRIVYELINRGGRVDRYVINPETKEVMLGEPEFKRGTFHVKKDHLFEANDELFPKGE